MMAKSIKKSKNITRDFIVNIVLDTEETSSQHDSLPTLHCLIKSAIKMQLVYQILENIDVV